MNPLNDAAPDGVQPTAPIMAYVNGKPVYYGTPEAQALAMRGLARVKAAYGTKSKQWKRAVEAALGVLGPAYNGPDLNGRTASVPPLEGPGVIDMGGDIVPRLPTGPDPYSGRPQTRPVRHSVMPVPSPGMQTNFPDTNYSPPPRVTPGVDGAPSLPISSTMPVGAWGTLPGNGPGMVSDVNDQDLMLRRALHQAMLTKMSPASRNLLAMRHLMRTEV